MSRFPSPRRTGDGIRFMLIYSATAGPHVTALIRSVTPGLVLRTRVDHFLGVLRTRAFGLRSFVLLPADAMADRLRIAERHAYKIAC